MHSIACEVRSVYKHYETSDDVFVDREEYLEWMDEALIRCKKKSVVLHLKGIGGIGKSSLLKQWIKTKERTVRVDCEHYSEFYSRLNVLAKGAVLYGVNLQRFDVLWQIRQRFVEGVEPVKEEGREWAKDVVMAIPFIGSLASIGSALSAVGTRVTPKLKGKYSTVGKWLQERLGKNHIERLLEILWKEPRHAEFLYIDALLEDINNRKDIDTPILFLMDHFEYVDSENAQWRYQGKKITQTELWSIFLSSLKNCVGVMAGRKPAVKREDLDLEETELTELDRDSCIEMLDLRGVADNDLQEKIVSVSAGNPFVVDAICDMKDEGTIALDDIECLRADTLEEVRLKTWRRLFNMAGDLQDIINRAGLLQSFDRNLLSIVAPSMTTDTWDRLLRLSFVRDREDGTWVFHDLAYELILAELGPRVKSLTDEVAQLLEKRAEDDGNPTLIGHAISVSALSSEETSILEVKDRIHELLMKDEILDAQKILDTLTFQSIKGHAEIQGLRAKALRNLDRYSEAEDAVREAIRINEELAKNEPEKHLDSVAEYLCELWELLRFNRYDESKEAIAKSLEIQRMITKQGTPKQLESLAWILVQYSWSLVGSKDAIPAAKEAVTIYRKSGNASQLPYALHTLAVVLIRIHEFAEALEVDQEAIEAQRTLIESEPDNSGHKKVLAPILNSNAILVQDFKGDMKKAEELFTEALEINRNLLVQNPEHSPDFMVLLLWNLGVFYLRIHKFDESDSLLQELLEIVEEKIDESPEVYSSWLENGFFTLALLKSARGKSSEAISTIERAINQCRKRVHFGSIVRRLFLGTQLSTSAVIHMRINELEKSENLLMEAIQLFRDCESIPPVQHGNFISILSNYGILLWRKGRISEAKEVLEEALELSFRKVEEIPESFNGLYSYILCNLSVVLADYGEFEAAEPRFMKALSLLENLVLRTPEQYRLPLAIMLHNHSHFQHKTGRMNEAHSSLERAIELKRELIKEHPNVWLFDTSLAKSLSNLGVMNGVEKRQMEWEEKYITFEEIP